MSQYSTEIEEAEEVMEMTTAAPLTVEQLLLFLQKIVEGRPEMGKCPVAITEFGSVTKVNTVGVANMERSEGYGKERLVVIGR